MKYLVINIGIIILLTAAHSLANAETNNSVSHRTPRGSTTFMTRNAVLQSCRGELDSRLSELNLNDDDLVGFDYSFPTELNAFARNVVTNEILSILVQSYLLIHGPEEQELKLQFKRTLDQYASTRRSIADERERFRFTINSFPIELIPTSPLRTRLQNLRQIGNHIAVGGRPFTSIERVYRHDVHEDSRTGHFRINYISYSLGQELSNLKGFFERLLEENIAEAPSEIQFINESESFPRGEQFICEPYISTINSSTNEEPSGSAEAQP